jgi:glycosyltransferase involved in cell wall biosynthesis
MRHPLQPQQPNFMTIRTEFGTVLFISHDTSRTGGPIFLLRFLRWLRENTDIPFRVLAGNRGDLYADFASLCPVDSFEPEFSLYYRILRKLKLNGRHRERYLAGLRQKLQDIDIRLIYANTIATGEMLEFLSFANCPVLCHVHELEGTIGMFGARNLSLVKNRTSRYIAVSGAVKNNLVHQHGIPEDTIRMIYGFIPRAERVEQSAVDARSTVFQELKLPATAKLVCACGSIDARKGADLFLQVAEKVTRIFRDAPVHFVWVGGRGEAVARMKKQVASYCLPELVHFTGPRENVGPFYQASDVFVLPSREDPFPLVMMEAALRAKPIVCFDQSGGAPEFVELDAGFVVPPLDVDRMAQKVVELLSSPELSRRMGNAARNKVLTRHTVEIGAPKIASVIKEELLSSGYFQQEQAVTPEHKTH